MGGAASTSKGKSSPFFVDMQVRIFSFFRKFLLFHHEKICFFIRIILFQDEHGTSVNCMAMNDDCTLMVTGGDDGTVCSPSSTSRTSSSGASLDGGCVVPAAQRAERAHQVRDDRASIREYGVERVGRWHG